MRYTATLPLPPSLNRSYHGTGTGGVYLDPKAKQWKRTASDLLLLNGWRRQPPGDYRLRVEYCAYIASNRDIDAGSKLLLDVLADQLGINDRTITSLYAQKVPTKTRAEHRMDVIVEVIPVHS